jgi:hypothetical protein
LNKRLIFLTAVMVVALVVGSFALINFFSAQNIYEAHTSEGLHFGLATTKSISVVQRGSTNVEFSTWLDSDYKVPANVTLTCVLNSHHQDNLFNFTLNPSSFTLQPNQKKTFVLTISASDQTPTGEYNFEMQSLVWGFINLDFEVTHATNPQTASINYWLNGSQKCDSTGDSFLTIHTMNWGGAEGAFNLTAVLGNAKISNKTDQPCSLINDFAVVFPVTLQAGEQKDINIHFTASSRFNITLSLSSNQENLHIEPPYISGSYT